MVDILKVPSDVAQKAAKDMDQKKRRLRALSHDDPGNPFEYPTTLVVPVAPRTAIEGTDAPKSDVLRQIFPEGGGSTQVPGVARDRHGFRTFSTG